MSHLSEPSIEDTHRALLPPAPTEVPGDLTAPSSAFKRSAWVAMLGLLGFVAVYFGLTGYFAWIALRFGLSGTFQGVLVAIPATFFFAFLVRGLFAVKHAIDPAAIEITPTEQPKLFAYLHDLADATGAPRPHRVFVSARVNAAVFYDLSFRNLILPSKKNLEIGLGLVEALSLDEMKAVVAHEFGHFAQKTMAVGRWVYVAQQVAAHIIAARTGFDRMLAFVASIDLRVAWIGWIMQLFVWAIRAILDTFFRLVLLAKRALGRQMEFQADRVAVSVSGSDSLIHALHRLGSADEAWDAALRFSLEEAGEGRPVEDLFALEAAMLGHLRRILDEPEFGSTPDSPARGTDGHRVFETKLANPPRMWATHPPSREREDHAKATYLPSTLDPRSAWALFDDAAGLRRRVTRAFFAPRPKTGAPPPSAPKAPVPIADSLVRLEEQYRRASLDPRYRGVYLGRSVAGFHVAPTTMIGSDRTDDRAMIQARIDALYPDSMRELLARYREHREEEMLLQGLVDGVLSAPGGIVRHRGREIRRRELPDVVADVKSQRQAVERELVAHDVSCRAAYLDAAAALGQGWAAYLEHLTRLLHYASHGARSLRDEHSYLHHVLGIVLADGRVSSDERRRLMGAATVLYDDLRFAWGASAKVELVSAVAERFEKRGGYKVLKQALGLNAPNDSNLADWLNVIDGWAGEAAADLEVLAQATLDALLEVEAYVGDHHAANTDPGPAPALGSLPNEYPKCVIGSERERQKRLGLWDRFQTADGLFPGLARFGVASMMLAPAMFVGNSLGTSAIHAFNGLPVAVDVTVDDETKHIEPRGRVVFEHVGEEPIRITSRAGGAMVETFEYRDPTAFGDYVYNVASAAVLSEWTAEYGTVANEDGDRILGAPRFVEVAADAILEAPPRSISSRGGGGTRTVVEAVATSDDVSARALIRAIDASTERVAIATAHLRYAPYGSDDYVEWLDALESIGQGTLAVTLVHRRSAESPLSVGVERFVDDQLADADKAAGCARRQQASNASPDDADRLYLAIRCIDDVRAREASVLAAVAQHPTHPYIAYSAARVLAARSAWRDAMAAFTVAMGAPMSAAWRDAATLEALRTHRAAVHAGADGFVGVFGTPAGAGGAAYRTFLAIEGAPSADEPPDVTLLRKLSVGDLPGFLAGLGTGTQRDPGLVVLAGASDGAPAHAVRDALGVDPRGLSAIPLFALAGLAAENASDSSAIEAELIRALDDEAAPPIAGPLVAALRAKDAAAIESLAAGCVLRAREMVLSAGLVALRQGAPSAWRDEVRAVSFATEHPFFH